MRSASPLVLALALAPGCAFAGGLPGAPPPDFALAVSCRGGLNPHCDYELRLRADGSLDYAVEHRGTSPAGRRGGAALSAEALAEVWRAVASSGIFDLRGGVPPQAGGEERGLVTWEVRAAGRSASVRADHAGDPGLDGVLRALFRVTPRRIWRPPGGDAE